MLCFENVMQLTITSSEKLLRVRLASITLTTKYLRHGQVDLEILSVNVAVTRQSCLPAMIQLAIYPTRAPTTLACAAYRLGAVSVFRKRRGAKAAILGETRIALRSMGVEILEAIVFSKDAQWKFCSMDHVFDDCCTGIDRRLQEEGP